MEDRPAAILAAIRRLTHSADRSGTLIDPQQLIDICEGRKA